MKKGFKIRVVQSPLYVKFFQEIGAVPQAMSWGDAYTALQQGAIDGQENALHVMPDTKVNEVNEYISGTKHIVCWASIYGSKKVMDKLPEDIQEIIKQAGAEACEEISELAISREKEYINWCEENGMKYNDVDNFDDFKAYAEPVYEWYKENYDSLWLTKVQKVIK